MCEELWGSRSAYSAVRLESRRVFELVRRVNGRAHAPYALCICFAHALHMLCTSEERLGRCLGRRCEDVLAARGEAIYLCPFVQPRHVFVLRCEWCR